MRFFEYDKEKSHSEYYKRNVAFWGLCAGFIPAVAITSVSFERLFYLQGATGFVVVGWMIAWMAAGFWRITWRCPRCHNRFYFKWWYGRGFTTKCVHCGFRPGGA